MALKTLRSRQPTVLSCPRKPECRPRSGLNHAGVPELGVTTHRQDIHFLWRPSLSDPRDEFVLELAVAASCEAIIVNCPSATRCARILAQVPNVPPMPGDELPNQPRQSPHKALPVKRHADDVG